MTVNPSRLREELLHVVALHYPGIGQAGQKVTALEKARAVFHDPTIQRKVKDWRLIASLAMLVGTPGEGKRLISLSDAVESVAFGIPPGNVGTGDDAYAQVVPNESGTAFRIIVSEKYEHEDRRFNAVALAHEAIHVHEGSSTPREEPMASAIGTVVYAQFVKEDPALAGPIRDPKNPKNLIARSELQQRQNMALLALVNSRENGQIRLLAPTAEDYNVYPGDKAPLRNFGFPATSIGLGPETSFANDALGFALGKITGQNMMGANFDQMTLDILDQNINNAFLPTDWVEIAKALHLNLNPATTPA